MLLLFCAAATDARAEEPLTLSDCYRLALKQSEEIAVRQELITENEGRFQQALSGILPRLSFSSTDKRQDGSGGSAFTLRKVPERKFMMSQPLFSGFKEFAAMAGAKAERKQLVQQKARAEQLLLVDVADAFMLLLEQREDLKTLDTIHAALLDRIEELKSREQLGRSRPSEVVSAQAQMYRIEAERELVLSHETTARQLLEFLTGREPIGPISERDSAPASIGFESAYLEKAASRADVQAALEIVEIAKQEVHVAQSKFWPTVGLDGNYFVERAGASKDVSWDASLKVEVPIFQGGEAMGGVKEASSKARQARLRFAEVRRQAVQSIRDAYAKVEAALARNAALAKALAATEQSYQFYVDEYRLSLVSNLDVLKSLQELQDARRDFIHADYEFRRLYWQLKVAAGETL